MGGLRAVPRHVFSKSDFGKIPSAKLGTEQSAHGMLRDFDSINAIKYWGCQKQNKLNCKS